MATCNLSDQSPLFHWLALERIPRVGPLTIARLYDGFKSPKAALQADSQKIRTVTGLSEKLARTIAEYAIPCDQILRDMETLDRIGARVITRWDPDYPQNLKEIYDPPAMLFVRGTLVPEDGRAVAVVGTRNPTHYGIKMAETLTRDLVMARVTVVSGLARGIDGVCHRTALKHRGRTIGVVGCGIDVAYPREHQELIELIKDSGAVISEFRPGVRPLATNFYRRNRVVSGPCKRGRCGRSRPHQWLPHNSKPCGRSESRSFRCARQCGKPSFCGSASAAQTRRGAGGVSAGRAQSPVRAV